MNYTNEQIAALFDTIHGLTDLVLMSWDDIMQEEVDTPEITFAKSMYEGMLAMSKQKAAELRG